MRGLYARVMMSEGQFLGPSYESRGTPPGMAPEQLAYKRVYGWAGRSPEAHSSASSSKMALPTVLRPPNHTKTRTLDY